MLSWRSPTRPQLTIQKSKADKGKIVHVDRLKHAFPPRQEETSLGMAATACQAPRQKVSLLLRDTDAREGGSDSESSTGVEDMVLPPLPSDSDDGSLLFDDVPQHGTLSEGDISSGSGWSQY